MKVQAEEISFSDENNLQILFTDAVKDAMVIDEEEILPVISLDEGEPYAVYDEDGRILLYTFHKYPDSYLDGTDVKREWEMYGHLQEVSWQTGIRRIRKL